MSWTIYPFYLNIISICLLLGFLLQLLWPLTLDVRGAPSLSAGLPEAGSWAVSSPSAKQAVHRDRLGGTSSLAAFLCLACHVHCWLHTAEPLLGKKARTREAQVRASPKTRASYCPAAKFTELNFRGKGRNHAPNIWNPDKSNLIYFQMKKTKTNRKKSHYFDPLWGNWKLTFSDKNFSEVDLKFFQGGKKSSIYH